MRIAVLGARGQLGAELTASLRPVGDTIPLGRERLDLTDRRGARSVLRDLAPDLIVNAAAYTDVEGAETDTAACRAVNEGGPELLADYCSKVGAVLVHYSTDYVFDGGSTSPYRETDVPSPVNVYGWTKLAGEAAIRASGAIHLILRCSWMYSGRERNFVATILRLARESRAISVVDDQRGCPTWARCVADATAQIVRRLSLGDTSLREAAGRVSGIYHLSSSDCATWYEFARAIIDRDPRQEEHRYTELRPIASGDYYTRAKRPAQSALLSEKVRSVFDVALPSWREQLAAYFDSGA
jgi:dTDP-4-dehydrorhamnose reductase